jgi:RHS repeat-associated protein
MIMPDRKYQAANYRFGFNGKEDDNEVKGFGNEQDYGARIYDPRLGQFKSPDPLTKKFPWYSPYQFAGNKPIWAADLDGLEEWMKTQENLAKQKAQVVIQGIGKPQNQPLPIQQSLPAFSATPLNYDPREASFRRSQYERDKLVQNAFTLDPVAAQGGMTIAETFTAPVKYTGQIIQGAQEGDKSKVFWNSVGLVLSVQPFTSMEGKLAGSGPVSGVFEISSEVKSVAAFKNFKPAEPVEFVYDPINQKFLVGQPNQSMPGLSGHQQLVKVGNLNNEAVVGGMFMRGANGEIITNELSGHYYQNWTDAIRKSFQEFIKTKTGQKVIHNK